MLKQIECAVSHCLPESYFSLSDRQTRIIILQTWGDEEEGEGERERYGCVMSFNFGFTFKHAGPQHQPAARNEALTGVPYSLSDSCPEFLIPDECLSLSSILSLRFLCYDCRHYITSVKIKVNRSGVNRRPFAR